MNKGLDACLAASTIAIQSGQALSGKTLPEMD
jgi:hypothetical protein